MKSATMERVKEIGFVLLCAAILIGVMLLRFD